MVDREKVRRRAYAQRRLYRIYWPSFNDGHIGYWEVPFLRGADWINVGKPRLRIGQDNRLLRVWSEIRRVKDRERRVRWLKQEIAARNTYL